MNISDNYNADGVKYSSPIPFQSSTPISHSNNKDNNQVCKYFYFILVLKYSSSYIISSLCIVYCAYLYLIYGISIT